MTERILLLSSSTESVRAFGDRATSEEIEVLQDPAAALEAAQDEGWGAVLVDSGFAGGSGEEVARRLAGATGTPIVLLARVPSLELTVSALETGIRAVLPFPPDPDEVRARLSLEREDAEGLPLTELQEPDGLLGRDPAMLELFRSVARVARTDENLLIRGEAGTGKGTLARILHRKSTRSNEPLGELGIEGLPEGLVESELFGHEAGTFPWAIARRTGRLERAHGGTLILDDVERLSQRLQLKLLDALRDGLARRVGSEQDYDADVRVVACTRGDVSAAVEEGRFLPELYHRIAALSLEVQPLHERGDDIVLLARHFGAVAARRCSADVSSLSASAAEKLEGHDWPGNVRELEQVMNHAVLVTEGPAIEPRHLPARIHWRAGGVPSEGDDGPPPSASLDEVEAEHIRRVFASTEGNISRAADILGIHRNTLRRKLEKYGIRR